MVTAAETSARFLARSRLQDLVDLLRDAEDGGLEWTVPSPAPFHTFETPPVVK